jgi:hypothetical protein
MTDDHLAGPARVKDDELAGMESGSAARTLFASIVAENVVPLRRSRLPKMLSTAAAVVVLTAGGVVGASVLQGGTGQTSYANSAIEVELEDGFYVATIKDPLADSAEFAEAFRAVGKDVDIELVPVSPRQVGQLLESSLRGHGTGSTDLIGTGCARDPAACTMVLRVSADTSGPVRYRIGRTALPGETLLDPAHN